MFCEKIKSLITRDFYLGQKVIVESADGTILSNEGVITAISTCKNFIQTNLGLSYLPKEQIKKK